MRGREIDKPRAMLMAVVIGLLSFGCSSQERDASEAEGGTPGMLSPESGEKGPVVLEAARETPRAQAPSVDATAKETSVKVKDTARVEDTARVKEMGGHSEKSARIADVLEVTEAIKSEGGKEGSEGAPAEPTVDDVLRETLLAQGTVPGLPQAGSQGTEGGPSEMHPSGIDVDKARDLLAMAVMRQTQGEGAVTRGGDPAPQAPPPAAGAKQQPQAPSPPPAAKPEPKPQPPPAAKPEGAPPAPEGQPPPQGQPPAQPPPKVRGIVMVKELYHKTSEEFLRFVKESFPEWIENKNVAKVEGKGRSILIVGDTPDPNDPLAKKISGIADSFDDLELKLESRKIKPRYVDVRILIDTLVMRGLANVWQLTEETATQTWKVGEKQVQASAKHSAYIQTGLVQGATAPIPTPPKIPYVYEIAITDPFEVPRNYQTGSVSNMDALVDFRNTASTEDRGGMMAVGTYEDLEEIQAFVDSIDVPARQILVEVQVIQLDANKLVDLGVDSAQFGERHTIGNVALPFPGESIPQPGLGEEARRDGIWVPDISQEGISTIFDDTSRNLAGRFMISIHALVREGDATIKARPKILTLDDRTSILHLGRTVPVFKSTGVTHDATLGNIISEIKEVENMYVGFTLNIRPRVSGGAEDEISMETELVVNEMAGRERVYEEDLLGIPNIITRRYVGQNRVKNHRPIVLGGLIQEEEGNSVNKIPLLADIPLLGYLFRRTQTHKGRQEVILVLTPHILSDKGWDRQATPKESAHFDTFDSVLFNDMHIIKGRDVIGIDPITGNPAHAPDGKLFTEDEVLDLTLLNIIKGRRLISKLGIIDDYLGQDAGKLSWVQRKWPEATVASWADDEKELYFRAAAIVLENIKELNPDLTYEELVTPRREIVLPTTPYRISLSYDRVKGLQEIGTPYLALRGQTVPLTEKTVAMMRDASGRSLREFADFLEGRKRKPEDHGDMIAELKRLYSGQNPTSNALEGVAYPEVYRQLAAGRFDFVSLATYFRENLTDRYQTVGAPNVGLLELDLKAFLETSVSLYKRAKTLMALEEKWYQLNTQLEEEAGLEGAVPSPEEK